MKILQLCTKVPFPPKDGGAAAVLTVSKTLSSQGHHVDLLAVNAKKHFIPPGETKHLPFTIHAVPINTQTTIAGVLYNLFTNLPYHVARFRSKAFSAKLISLLTTNSYDIVQLEGIYLCNYLPLIRQYSKARIILRAHNVEHLLWKNIAHNESRLLYKLYLSIQAKRIKKFETTQLQYVDGIVAISEPDKEKFRQLNNQTPVITLPYGIEPVSNLTIKEETSPSLFYIGALDWLPNQEGLIWFLDKVWPHRNHPSLEFHIAGRNAPRWLIQKVASFENTFFHGEIEQSSEFMLMNNIMIVPLFSGSGMRVKIIEAMSLGKTIIATQKACEGIPLTHGKHLWMANTSEEFTSTIAYCLNNSEAVLPIRKEARKFVHENFDAVTLSSKLIEFYQNRLS